MSSLRKITMNMPAELADDLPAMSGQTMTAAIRTAVQDYRHRLASRKILVMCGKIQFDLSRQELREKDEE